MGGASVVSGADILLASHATATSERGPEYLNLSNADWQDTSATDARSLPSVEGLGCRTNLELAGADTVGSCNPAKSGMPLASKAMAKTDSAKGHARAAHRLTKYCEG
jgi:hypothetical protein